MKIRFAAVSLSFLAFATAASAFADFRPGRVRPGYVSDMRTVESSGDFAGLAGAHVTLDYADGKADPVRVTVTLPNEDGARTLAITKIRKSLCGDRIDARSLDRSGFVQKLVLVDYSHVQCRMAFRNQWTVKLTQTAPGRDESELDLEGNPEAVYVTM